MAVAIAGALMAAAPVAVPLMCPQPAYAEQQANQRQVFDFNTDWRFVRGNDSNARKPNYDDAGAERVSLPHARDAYDLYNPDIDALQTVDWYRRHFTLDKKDEGDRVIVSFRGGGQINRVYVNGAFVGEAKGAFTHFSFDITDFVTFGDFDNVISVQVDSRYHSNEMPPGRQIDFHFFGGLHGQAELALVDPVHAESVFYYNDDVVAGVQTAKLHGSIDVRNNGKDVAQATVTSIVRAADGSEVARAESRAAVAAGQVKNTKKDISVVSPHLWSCDDPYLYEVETKVALDGVEVDSQKTNIGIRTFKTTGKPGTKGAKFQLNGEDIDVVGGNRHMQVPYLGNSLTDKLNERDAEMLKSDLGINFVRTSHYENDPAFLDACDRLGLLVEEEPLGWNDTPGLDQFDYSTDEMVKRDRNHASVVMWSIIPNERNADEHGLEWTRRRNEAVKKLDPSRLTIQEEHQNSTPVADVYGWHDYFNPEDSNEQKRVNKPQKAESWFVTEWNTNLGKHFVVPNDSETRKRDQVYKDGKKMETLMGDDRIMGTLKWDLFGYLTPNTNGERAKNVEKRRYAGVYGQWRDPLNKTWMANLMACQAPNREDVGDIVFINSEWKDDAVKKIAVTSNCDSVELYYGDGKGDEKLVGRLDAPNKLTKLKHGLFEFELKAEHAWSEDSYLLAKGYVAGSHEPVKQHKVFASTYTVERAGVSMDVHNTVGDITADGADVAWILAELKDENGQREFYGDESVEAEIVSGPGELVYAGDAPVMTDGMTGLYLRSEKDNPGSTVVRVSADMGVDMDDSDRAISYDNKWSKQVNKVDAFNGGYTQTTNGGTASFTFTGTQLALYAESSPNGGSATVSIDGKPAGKFECKNNGKYGTIGNFCVFRSRALQPGEHHVEIEATGRVNIDRVKVFDGVADVSGEVTVNSIADTSERVESNDALPQAPEHDAESPLELDLAIADAQAIDRSAYDPRSLARLDDALCYARAARQEKGVPGSAIGKATGQLRDAIESLLPLSAQRINHNKIVMEDQMGGVVYTSKNADTWQKDNDKHYAKKSRVKGDKYSITFKGEKIELFSHLDDAHGKAEIKLDGKKVETVDMYRAAKESNVKFFERDGLDDSTHKVEVIVTGEKSDRNTKNDNACVSFAYANVYTKVDPEQQACVAMGQKMDEAKGVSREGKEPTALQVLDSALFAAEDALRDEKMGEADFKRLSNRIVEALAGLKPQGIDGSITVTCKNADRAQVQGEVGKVFYSSMNPAEDWILEKEGQDEFCNRYLKKVCTGQSPAPYAELVFEGTGIELFARHSNTSGYAHVEVLDGAGAKVAGKDDICLYDKSVDSNKAATRSIFKVDGLKRGRYVARLYPANRAAENNGDKTSINFAKAVVLDRHEQVGVDTSGLTAALDRANSIDLSRKHDHQKADFLISMRALLDNSWHVLGGAVPQVAVVSDLPEGTTQARIDRLETYLDSILAAVEAKLVVTSVDDQASIVVPFGTKFDQLGLPESVRLLTSAGQKTRVGVSWSSDGFNSEHAGTYILEGSLEMPKGLENPDGVRSTIKVTVEEKQAVPQPQPQPQPQPEPESDPQPGPESEPQPDPESEPDPHPLPKPNGGPGGGQSGQHEESEANQGDDRLVATGDASLALALPALAGSACVVVGGAMHRRKR